MAGSGYLSDVTNKTNEDNSYWADVTKEVEKTKNSALAPRQPKNDLDKDAFLKLMLAQMKYQDPLNPVDDKQFLAQMAQFTSLEQMQNMNSSMLKSQAYSMIGKYITSEFFNEETNLYDEATGVVEAVLIKNGNTYLRVGEKDVPIEKVTAVIEEVPQSEQLQNVQSLLATSQVLTLVGKYIQAITLDEKMKPKEFVEGQVDYVKFSGNTPIIVVGNKEIFAPEITSISNQMMLIGKTISAKIDTMDEPIKGTITGVSIKDGSSFLEVNGQSVRIEKINRATEALQLVGTNVRADNIAGKAESVIIKKGEPYLVVGGVEVSYEAVRTYKGSAGSE